MDVLDKVGVLRILRVGMRVTKEMVAELGEVPRETIFTLVRNNREEIEGGGYRVVTRSAFEESYPKQLTSSATRIAYDQKGVRVLHTLGGMQQLAIVSEAGFYAAILAPRSRHVRGE
ncbi:BRO-N domain-containing protein [Nocardia terpenica]|uniref:Uncharacterized protein n=1 Tax=Nocardia terpenica TaxID=455432 RepID=A0A291RC59_9NOCA|nr:hypothetical protein [Nocardia terpenica]ATL64870.1 hypothetical protein CRH09_00075 [Nocardia terpenica]